MLLKFVKNVSENFLPEVLKLLLLLLFELLLLMLLFSLLLLFSLFSLLLFELLLLLFELLKFLVNSIAKLVLIITFEKKLFFM